MAERSLKHLTRGGQVFLHNLRMITQVFNQILLVVLIGVVIFNVAWFFTKLTFYERYVLWQWVSAYIKVIFFGVENYQTFVDIDGSSLRVLSQSILDSSQILSVLTHIKLISFKGAQYSIWFGLGFMFVIIGWLKRRGKKQGESEFIRGTQLTEAETLTQNLKDAGQASNLTMAGVPIVKDSEVQHFLIHGTVGTGKSVCLKELMHQARANKQRAVVYDKGCDFVRSFYRPGKDIILNPLDERTEAWDIWSECRDGADFDTMAAALMPLPSGGTGDPFWINAARTIFACLAHKMLHDPERSNLALLQNLFTSELDDLHALLRGTEAETLVSPKTEKTALNVKSVLANYLKPLKYLKEDDVSFSIRDWLRDDGSDSWLFISSQSDKHETLKPLISAWFNTVANGLLSLSPSRDRRIWVFLDELPTLHQLPYLPGAFAEARKFGGCLVAAMQSFSQLQKIYGQHAANEISGLCSTRVYFRTPETATAQWVANNLGYFEADEPNEGVSYGANSFRDGVSVSHHRAKRQLVLGSEVEALNDLDAYLRLKGDWPIAKVKFTPKDYGDNQPGFVPRKFSDSELLSQVGETMDGLGKKAVLTPESPAKQISDDKDAINLESDI